MLGSGLAHEITETQPQSIIERGGNAVLHVFGLAAILDSTVLLIDLIYILI
jgi:glutamyl-tRNA reductase